MNPCFGFSMNIFTFIYEFSFFIEWFSLSMRLSCFPNSFIQLYTMSVIINPKTFLESIFPKTFILSSFNHFIYSITVSLFILIQMTSINAPSLHYDLELIFVKWVLIFIGFYLIIIFLPRDIYRMSFAFKITPFIRMCFFSFVRLNYSIYIILLLLDFCSKIWKIIV